MFRKSFISFIISFNNLFLVFFISAINLFRRIISFIFSLKNKKVTAVFYYLSIARIEVTFCKRQIMKRIKQICFTRTVIAGKTIQFFGKIKFCLFNIFKVCNSNGFQKHIFIICSKNYLIFSQRSLKNLKIHYFYLIFFIQPVFFLLLRPKFNQKINYG